MITETTSKIKLNVFETRNEMGRKAGADIESKIVELLNKQESIRMIFAAAPSQNESLEYLYKSNKIDWSRIEAFHMDEYIGLPSDAPQAFAMFLKKALFDDKDFANVNLIQGNLDADEICNNYSNLLKKAPIDIVCLGIGENGHIAFNDPPVANFSDTEIMKPVELDMACRQQQVNDGCFTSIDKVPTHALTLTIPTLMAGKHLFCVVPGSTKKEAVLNSLNGPITTNCPASILQKHEDCNMYVDKDSYGK